MLLILRSVQSHSFSNSNLLRDFTLLKFLRFFIVNLIPLISLSSCCYLSAIRSLISFSYSLLLIFPNSWVKLLSSLIPVFFIFFIVFLIRLILSFRLIWIEIRSEGHIYPKGISISWSKNARSTGRIQPFAFGSYNAHFSRKVSNCLLLIIES